MKNNRQDKPLATEIIQDQRARANRYRTAFFITLGLLVCTVAVFIAVVVK